MIQWRQFMLTKPDYFTKDEEVYMFADKNVRLTSEFTEGYATAHIEIRSDEGEILLEAEGIGSQHENALNSARIKLKDRMIRSFDKCFDFLNR